ncbi:hypothetical protein ACFU99_37590, partial [Streptomyces sp. NPDC057654]|uniref:hypothetical protein n=1 Tax=Streptomyces sp. NPDC057654 TaxID=3346196 RepID=UPI0036982BB7
MRGPGARGGGSRPDEQSRAGDVAPGIPTPLPDGRPLGDGLGPEARGALRQNPMTRPFVQATPSKTRKFANRAHHAVAPYSRGARVAVRNARRSAWSRLSGRPLPAREKSRPLWNTMWSGSGSSMRNNYRLPTGFAPVMLDPRVPDLRAGQVHHVVLTKTGRTRRYGVALRVRGVYWGPARWQGVWPGQELGMGLNNLSGFSQSSQTSQGKSVSGSVDAGPKDPGTGDRALWGLTLSRSRAKSRMAKAGSEGGSEYVLWSAPRVQAWDQDVVLLVDAQLVRAPRSLLRLVTGSAFRRGPLRADLGGPLEAPASVPLGPEADGALVIRTRARTYFPDMSGTLRELWKERGRGSRQGHAAPTARKPLQLPAGETRELVRDLHNRPIQHAEHGNHTHLRSGHAKPLAAVVSGVLRKAAPDVLKWHFTDREGEPNYGTAEHQTVEYLVADGALDTKVDAMLGAGWNLSRGVYAHGRGFRHTFALKIRALPGSHSARSVVDRGLSNEHSFMHYTQPGGGTGKQDTLDPSLRLSGAKNWNTAAPGATPGLLVPGGSVTLYNKTRSESQGTTLSFGRVAGEQRAGRQVLIVHENTTYLVEVTRKSRAIGAPLHHEAVAVEMGDRQELAGWQEAEERGLVTNGLERIRPSVRMRPLLDVPVGYSVQGTIDPRPALLEFQRALRARGMGRVLADSAVGDLGGLREALESLFNPDSVRGAVDELTMPGVWSFRHFDNQTVGHHGLGPLTGEVLVSLVPRGPLRDRGRPVFGTDLYIQLSKSEQDDSSAGLTRVTTLGTTALGLPGTEPNAPDGSTQGEMLALGTAAGASMSSSATSARLKDASSYPMLISGGRHDEFDGDYDLKLSYVRDDGTTVTVRAPAGSLRRIVGEWALVPELPDQASARRRPEDGATEPAGGFGAGRSAPGERAADDPITVVPVGPGRQWGAGKHERLGEMLTHDDVMLLNAPDTQRLFQRAVAVLDHAAAWVEPAAVSTPDAPASRASGTGAAPDTAGTVPAARSVRSLLRDHRQGRAHTGLTRPGQAGRQKLRQSIGQRAMILSGKEALGKKGYTPGDIHDGSAVGRSAGRVTVFLRPAESASARVIGVTDNAVVYDEKRVTDQASVGAGRSGMTANFAAAPYPAFYTGDLSTVAGDALPVFNAG